MFIPSMLLKQLYTHGSLQKTEDGLCFMLKNRLKDAHLEEILQISLDGKHIANEKITLKVGPDTLLSAEEVNASGNVPFPLREVITVFLDVKAKSGPEKLKLGIEFKAAPFGKLKFTVEDNISPIAEKPAGIPQLLVRLWTTLVNILSTQGRFAAISSILLVWRRCLSAWRVRSKLTANMRRVNSSCHWLLPKAHWWHLIIAV